MAFVLIANDVTCADASLREVANEFTQWLMWEFPNHVDTPYIHLESFQISDFNRRVVSATTNVTNCVNVRK